jgi:hypothetical protein
MATDYTEDGEDAGCNRPRRPNPDTIAYLRGLPLEVQSSTAEISSFLSSVEDIEFPNSLAASFSAIDEIRNEIASLAGDDFGSQFLEVLAHIAAPFSEIAARILLNACSGYHLHLATHRYGSHVVQTILQLAVSSSSKTDLALHEEAPQFSETADTLPSLADLILGIVEELSPHTSQLAIHVCGSHVLRTLLCVLGGVNLVSSPGSSGNENKMETGAVLRGRKKNKKKKKKKPDEAADGVPHAGSMLVVYHKDSRIACSQDDLSSALNSLSLALIGGPSDEPGELQQLSGHPSAGPLLIVLLRVLTYASDDAKEEWKQQQLKEEDPSNTNSSIADFRLGILRKEPTFQIDSPAHNLVRCLLCWKEGVEEQPHAVDIIYGLSGEPRGSHVLETLLRLSPDSVHDSIVKYGDFATPSSMQEYVEHDVSNFVIQTLLCTIRSKEQAEVMLKTVENIISSGLAVDPAKKRRGILWRAVELAAKFQVGQDSILKAIRLGFGTLNTDNEAVQATSGDMNNDSATTEDGEKKKRKRQKAPAIAIKDCIPKLIDLRKPEQEGGRIMLDVAGSRTVYHLLRFAPRFCEEGLNGVIEGLSREELQLIAKDGLGSRCIMDGILDGPVKTPFFATATKGLLAKLMDSWVALSVDRVGHHTAKKLFLALPRIDDRAKLVEELAGGGNRLSGNAMGRSVIAACLVEEYREDKKNWRKVVAKMLMPKDEGWLEEVIGRSDKDQEETKEKSKRKRKRKKAE